MIVGYKILCAGLGKPMAVHGDSYDDCMSKFKAYWSSDYDVDTDTIISVESINVDFDIV